MTHEYGTWLMHMGHDSCIWDATHSYRYRIVLSPSCVYHSNGTWIMNMGHDSWIWDVTHAYWTPIIHIGTVYCCHLFVCIIQMVVTHAYGMWPKIWRVTHAYGTRIIHIGTLYCCHLPVHIIQMGRDSCIWDMTHAYGTWLMNMDMTLAYGTWPMHMGRDSFTKVPYSKATFR